MTDKSCKSQGVIITGATKVYAIAGDPVEQVGSPERFNRRFRTRDIDAVLVPLHVGEFDLGRVIESLRCLRNFHGLVVTVPHKQDAMVHIDACTPRARRIGAVNAIRFTRQGAHGDNFDGEGFIRGLSMSGCQAQGRHALIIGAGGAGHAIADALAEAGAERIGIHDVDLGRAESLVDNLRRSWPTTTVDIVARVPTGFDIVINASPVGGSDSGDLPADPALIDAGAHVADILLKPRVSAFLRECEQRGHRIMPGYLMLDNQIDAISEFFEASSR